MDRLQTASIESRDFFRITDKLELTYRKVIAKELDAPNYNFDILATAPHQDLLNALELLTKDTSEILNKIAETNLAIANYLKILDHKILLLTKTLVYKTDTPKAKPQLVNLSEAGIAFGSEQPLPIKTQLRMQLILQPLFQEIAIYGQVIRLESSTEASHADPAYPYWVVVTFTHLQATDRQLLARYILQKQTIRSKAETRL